MKLRHFPLRQIFAALFALVFGYCLVKRCAEVLPCRDEEEFDPTWMDAELYEVDA